jgi:monoamine oxidase
MMRWSRRSVLAGGSAAIIAGAAPRQAWGKTEVDVAIIGAGLAGLYAAHRLEVEGLKCAIIEADSRVGGRLLTLDDLPGKPDAGGIQVGSNYKILRAIADDLKVALVPDGNGARDILYRINGQSVRDKDWKVSAANILTGVERERPPATLAGLYNTKLPKLEKLTDWLDPAAQAQLDVPYAQWLADLGASGEARRLIETNMNGNALTTMSALHIARATTIFREGAGPVSTIKGGSQSIPDALAAILTSPVRLNSRVLGIAEEADGVMLKLSGGQSLRARHAICTIPFSVLRGIPISGLDDKHLRTAINTLPYTRASFVYLQASEPFWRNDGMPEMIWSDDPMLGRVFILGDSPAMLKVWIAGPHTQGFDRLRPEAAAAKVIARIEAARPSAKGKLKALKTFSWQKQKFASGIYHHIGAGMGGIMAYAAQHKGKRLHFAGEHLAISASGMEGALESGNRVARMIAGIAA